MASNVEFMVQDAIGIVSDASAKKIELRLVGGIAVYLHCAKHASNLSKLYQETGRMVQDGLFIGDIDLIGYSSQRKHIVPFFEKEKGLAPDVRFNTMFGFKRLVYQKPGAYELDLFFDKLEYSHDIVFGNKPDKGRLNLDFPTVSLTDLLLSKLQIHKITPKDLLDIEFLLLFHDVTETDSLENISGARVTGTLASDWGFWFDAQANLQQSASLLESLEAETKLPSKDAETIRTRLDRLSKAIENTPKNDQWQKRAKTGTSKPWFRDVEEVVRT